MTPEPFEPSKDMPSLTDKVFLVTGGKNHILGAQYRLE